MPFQSCPVDDIEYPYLNIHTSHIGKAIGTVHFRGNWETFLYSIYAWRCIPTAVCKTVNIEYKNTKWNPFSQKANQQEMLEEKRTTKTWDHKPIEAQNANKFQCQIYRSLQITDTENLHTTSDLKNIFYSNKSGYKCLLKTNAKHDSVFLGNTDHFIIVGPTVTSVITVLAVVIAGKRYFSEASPDRRRRN